MSTRIRALAVRHFDTGTMRTFLFAVLVACAPRALSVTADHPANPDAQGGRLAGPPPALQAGFRELPAGDPGTKKPAVDKKPELKQPAPKQPEKKPEPRQPVDPHEGHH